MRRFRFYVPGRDGRPMAFPPIGPFWISGESDTHQIVIAYSPSLEVLTDANHWPDAENIDDQGETEIKFSERFPKPDWWKEE
jgi:hypothetical protein